MLVEGRGIGKIDLAEETEEMTQSMPRYLSTKLARIAEPSEREPNKVFEQLTYHFHKGALRKCFNMLDRKAARGNDGITKGQYEQNLDRHLEELVARMRQMNYRPSPIREVHLPKEGKAGATRPLGISNVEDKIVQTVKVIV